MLEYNETFPTDYSDLDRLPLNRNFSLSAPLSDDGEILLDANLPPKNHFGRIDVATKRVSFGANKGDESIEFRAFDNNQPIGMQFLAGGHLYRNTAGEEAFDEPQSQVKFTRKAGETDWSCDVPEESVSEESVLRLAAHVIGTIVTERVIKKKL